MTIKETLIEFLESNGMFNSQAEQVFIAALPRLETEGRKENWAAPSTSYPEVVYAVWMMILKDEALKWIDANSAA